MTIINLGVGVVILRQRMQIIGDYYGNQWTHFPLDEVVIMTLYMLNFLEGT